MDLNPEKEFEDVPQQELQEAIENLTQTNVELRDLLSCYQKENADYKRKCKKLEDASSKLQNLLEKTSCKFHSLYSAIRNALDLSRSSLSGPLSPFHENNLVQSPAVAGPSNANQELYEERLNLRRLQKNLVREDSIEDNLNLTTILESTVENRADNCTKASSVVTKELYGPLKQLQETRAENCTKVPAVVTKELYVSLKRLPQNIVQEYIEKYNGVNETNISLNISSFSTNELPHFSSTPHKVETFQILGLQPVTMKSPKFINVATRRKEIKTSVKLEQSPNASGVQNKQKKANSPSKFTNEKRPSKVKVSVVKEEISPSRRSSRKLVKVKEENSISTFSNEKRPSRRARPTNLTETSLRKKMRRS